MRKYIEIDKVRQAGAAQKGSVKKYMYIGHAHACMFDLRAVVKTGSIG